MSRDFTNEQKTSKQEPGQPVWVQDLISLSWKPATMKEHVDEPSSYWIQTMENSILRENKKTSQTKVKSYPF